MSVARVMLVFGTRPEAIKMAPLVLALARSPQFEPIVTVTAQHRALLDQVLELFEIVPDHDLDVLQHDQTLTDITVRVLDRLTPVLAAAEPDVVVVQGDTTTTFAGALAAFYRRVDVVHLEAGLRTGDVSSPFPEELNRRLTTQLAARHLAPTPSAMANLLAEGVHRGAVTVTGNTVIDALLWAAERHVPYGDERLEEIDRSGRPVLLVTMHRREAWGTPMARVGKAIARLAALEPDLVVVFPVHPNRAVRDSVLPPLARLDNVVVTEPLPYGAFARMLARATVVLTDSGGVQEEAPSLGRPVLVVRDNTERPEALAAGTARLVGTDHDRVVEEVLRLLNDPVAYAEMAMRVNPYGDGLAAERCIAALAHHLGLGGPPAEFVPSAVGEALTARRS